MHDEFDDRTDDDMPPAVLPADFQVTLGSGWKFDAGNDGTIRLTERKTRRTIEIGFSDLDTIMGFLSEVALAGGAWSAIEQHRQKVMAQHPAGVTFDSFALITGAMRDAEAIR